MSWIEQLRGLLARNALTEHPIDISEIDSHVAAANGFLKDSENVGNSNASKSALAYSAGHHMLMAAIKMEGYKPVNQAGHRSILYDLISGLFPGAMASQVPMTRSHNRRNRAEYDIVDDVTNAQVSELVAAVKSVKEELDLKHKLLKKKNEAKAQPESAALMPSAPVPPVKPKKPPFKKK